MVILSIGVGKKLQDSIDIVHTDYYLETIPFYKKSSVKEVCDFSIKLGIDKFKTFSFNIIEYTRYYLYILIDNTGNA